MFSPRLRSILLAALAASLIIYFGFGSSGAESSSTVSSRLVSVLTEDTAPHTERKLVSQKEMVALQVVTASSQQQDDVHDTVNDKNPVVDGQLKDENKIEPPLPELDRSLMMGISLNNSATRFVNDAETQNIPITIGVLTAPALIRSRLIPLLESSLKRETDIHVFFKNDASTVAGQELLSSYLQDVNRSHQVHIVVLDPIRNMKMSLRNAWVNLPAVRHFHNIRPHQRWFAIIDDDTYLLMSAVRRLLREVELNETHRGKPVYMGTPLVDGVSGGCRVIRTGSILRVQRTTIRKEVQFVCGGSGILMDRLTIEKMFIKNATGYDYIEQCMDTMFQGAGDVRLGHCLSELNVSILPRRMMFRDTMFRALGETRVYNKYPFPVSFHRFRKREWQYAVRAVEDAREANELVTWGDLIKNFKPGPVYWPSMFYPKTYENYTKIYGIRVMTPHEIRRNKIICKRFQCCRKEVVEEW
jgi:hypothetical protein